MLKRRIHEQKNRKWLWNRVQNNQDRKPLTDDDIKCILDIEGENETLLLRWRPQQPLAQRRSQQRQLRKGTWFIRDGNYITLPELLWMGRDVTTCWNLYKYYQQLDTYFREKHHSMTRSPDGMEQSNAKHLSYLERNTYALPREGEPWEPDNRRRRGRREWEADDRSWRGQRRR